jgi:UPF0755 protein
MTVRGGGKPRGGVRGAAPQENRKIVDTGWDAYLPPDQTEAEEERKRRQDLRRSYRSARFRGPGNVVRFAVFAFVLGGLVTGGLLFVVRPAVVRGIVDWSAENPTALQLPFVSDLVRAELGSSLTDPIDPKDSSKIVITIAPDETPHQIGTDLVKSGVIADTRAFVFEAIQRGATEKFQIGRHEVSKAETMDQIIAALITAPVPPASEKVTFREGLRIEQMVAKLEYVEANPTDPTAPLTMNVKQFYDIVEHPPVDLLAGYPWISLPAGASLEGFLFPATYDLAPDTTPTQLVGMLLDAFATHAPPGLLDLPPDQIYQDVQIASLVETEAKVDSDRALIAGVYLNRLDPKKWPTLLLDADPTLNYANDSVWLESNDISTWVDYTFWNPIQTSGSLGQVVFPGTLAYYNTYHHPGLPPTPICSPSAASLAAAMAPDTSEGYLYFLAKNDGSGTHAFAKTEAEQNANLKKYGYVP